MKRISHGDMNSASPQALSRRARRATLRHLAETAAQRSDRVLLPDFGFMFEKPTPLEQLTVSRQTIDALIALGDKMGDLSETEEPDPVTDLADPNDPSQIPAIYTYFGQFIDHDLTKTGGATPKFDPATLVPRDSLEELTNERTPLLDLDSVYGVEGSADMPPRDTANPAKMKVDDVTRFVDVPNIPSRIVPGKALANDLPRQAFSKDAETDRAAQIGDPRNDENLIVAQLHTAFLKGHNELVDLGNDFDGARTALTLMYQSIIIDDYLPRICDAATLAGIVANGPRFFKADSLVQMPVEFSAAGFRFGHSMVRSRYDFNLNFTPAKASLMFTFSALSGQLGPGNGSENLPSNWIIEWERFAPVGLKNPQRARPIDTRLTPILFDLRNLDGTPKADTMNIAPHLAKLNLLRGYELGLPTGQAVCAKMKIAPVEISAAATGLPESAVAPISAATPLWFYILAEAAQNNGKLGAVGTTIVAETLISLLQRSKPSIFGAGGVRVSSARHTLADILLLADAQDQKGVPVS